MKFKNMKTFEEYSSELNISDVSDSKNKYTVVSLDYNTSKWGIEGDFYANDENDAIKQAKKQGIKRQMYNAFLSDSNELNDFIETNDFIY
jgi:hypothetical protein